MRNLSLASRNRSLFNKLLNLRYVASRLASYNCSRRAKYNFGCSFIALLLAGSFIAGNLQAQEKRETGWFVGTAPWSSPIQLEHHSRILLFSWASFAAIKLPASSKQEGASQSCI